LTPTIDDWNLSSTAKITT